MIGTIASLVEAAGGLGGADGDGATLAGATDGAIEAADGAGVAVAEALATGEAEGGAAATVNVVVP